MANSVFARERDDAFAFGMEFTHPEEAPGDISRLNDRLGGFLELRQIGPEDAVALQMAMEELLTNIAKFGRGPDGEALRVEGEVRLGDDELVLAVADNGQPFDPAGAAVPDLGREAPERLVGGLGLHILRQMFPGIEYRREAGMNASLWRRPRNGPLP